MTTTGEDRPAAVTGPWWWGRPRSAVLDVGLALLSAVECAAEGVAFARDTGLPVAVGVVFGLLAGSALVLRRRWPVAVVLVGVAVSPARMGVLLGLVGLYSLAASELPRRIIGVLSGMSLMATLIVTFVRASQDMTRGDMQIGEWVVPTVAISTAIGMTAPPVLLGLYVGARRRLMESLRERADSLERELQLLADRAEERAEWARNEERTRIARDMHDVVAHRVSLMVVHAAALQAVARKDPEKAVRNAALVGDMGRQALTELRQMLGVLRSGDGASPSVSASGVSAPAESAGSSASAASSAAASSAASSASSSGSGSVSSSAPSASSGSASDSASAAAAESFGSSASGASSSGFASAPSSAAEPAASASSSRTPSSASSSSSASPSARFSRSASSSSATSSPETSSSAAASSSSEPWSSGSPGFPASSDVPLAAVGAAAAAAASRAARDGSEGGPSLAELEELVGQSRAAGMAVELLVEGEARAYASAVEQTAYRVVQEALTNVHKHAGGARTRVRLAHRGGEVAMQVENEPPSGGVPDAGLPSGGNGLVGMRERVSALGGVFVSGPTDAGGFRVSAVLPVG
ncbi:sensor histidine kinase [Streptomyces sp. NA04227]|uniref:sensor histidine kinase n=1 Tax=Streptomyces sp. NA04227 TaxID=2742136 RepID=UPI001590DDF6|nr:histidine kinase [Streptomyces sp. NA04227]QKW07049.1 sensor histidine kinase [Streptomyces sp. NA04227]